jgi:hypothetical protein
MLALRPDALSACERLFVEEIARWQKRTAKARGIEGGETGAVTFVQRFNATLGSFVHYHVMVPDGLFTRTNEGRAGQEPELRSGVNRCAPGRPCRLSWQASTPHLRLAPATSTRSWPCVSRTPFALHHVRRSTPRRAPFLPGEKPLDVLTSTSTIAASRGAAAASLSASSARGEAPPGCR